MGYLDLFTQQNDGTSVVTPQIVESYTFPQEIIEFSKFYPELPMDQVAQKYYEYQSKKQHLDQGKEKTPYDKQQSAIKQKQVEVQEKEIEKAENAQKALKEVDGMMKFISPSSYVELFSGKDLNAGQEFTADILLDPTSYASFGLLPFVKKGSMKNLDAIIKAISKNKIRYSLPEAKYYRTLSDMSGGNASDAVEDIIKYGIVRSNPEGTVAGSIKENYIGPYFYEGTTFLPKQDKSSKILISSSENLDWLPIRPHQTVLQKEIGSKQFTPLYNGVPNTAPSSEFELWERGNNFITKHLWYKKDLPSKEINVDLFKYPENYNMFVHGDFGNGKGAFGQGAYINEMNTLIPGQNSVGQKNYIWFNKDKPYTLGVNSKPITRVIVGHKDNIDGLTKVRDMDIPVGQWDGSKGFVLNSEYVTQEYQDMDKLLLFEWDPVLKRFKIKL